MLRKISIAACLLMYSSFAMAEVSLGGISTSLMGPMAVLTKVILFISMICGIGFFLGSLIQYKYHRENPQQVRLSTPIVLFLLSLILIGFPLLLIYTGSIPWLE